MPIAGFLQLSHGRLAYEDQGEGDTLVFAHGLGGNHLSWWRQVAHFKATHRCVAFSHRGFAPSDPIPGGPDPSDYADDLKALLDHLGIDRAVIVAQSMGGWTAIEFALKNPDRVAGIVFACTTGSIDFAQCDHPALVGLPEWKQFARAEGDACRAAEIHVACGRRMAGRDPALHELYKEIDRLNASLDRDALLKGLFAMRARSPSDLDRIPAPKLFIAGAEDIVIPACGVEALAMTAKNARFARVEEAGHSVYFEHPAQFNAEVERFLEEIRTPAAYS